MSDPLITIAVSSRALFDFEEENLIFEQDGKDAYMQAQQDKLDTVATPGIAFPMVKKLLSFNSAEEHLVDVIVISRNDPTTGLRVFRSISDHHLDIRRGCFIRGSQPAPYLRSFGAQLFLSAAGEDVREALEQNFPAAHVMGSSGAEDAEDGTLRIAFDGDAVLFGDTAERYFQENGLEAFQAQEKELAAVPLPPGPIKPFLEALLALRAKLPPDKIRTALITARGAPAHERPIRTLMKWGLQLDEVFFLHGMNKQEVLNAFRPDFFFDDQVRHLHEEQPGGHVNTGVVNEGA